MNMIMSSPMTSMSFGIFNMIGAMQSTGYMMILSNGLLTILKDAHLFVTLVLLNLIVGSSLSWFDKTYIS